MNRKTSLVFERKLHPSGGRKSNSCGLWHVLFEDSVPSQFYSRRINCYFPRTKESNAKNKLAYLTSKSQEELWDIVLYAKLKVWYGEKETEILLRNEKFTTSFRQIFFRSSPTFFYDYCRKGISVFVDKTCQEMALLNHFEIHLVSGYSPLLSYCQFISSAKTWNGNSR